MCVIPIFDFIFSKACLMSIAWMFCASTGILLARYYKFLLPNVRIFKLQIWFVIHRPLMMIVPVISIVAFILILADLNWKWIETDQKLSLAHSIIGMIAIGFSLIQVLLLLFLHIKKWRILMINLFKIYRFSRRSFVRTKSIRIGYFSITFIEYSASLHIY